MMHDLFAMKSAVVKVKLERGEWVIFRVSITQAVWPCGGMFKIEFLETLHLIRKSFHSQAFLEMIIDTTSEESRGSLAPAYPKSYECQAAASMKHIVSLYEPSVTKINGNGAAFVTYTAVAVNASFLDMMNIL